MTNNAENPFQEGLQTDTAVLEPQLASKTMMSDETKMQQETIDDVVADTSQTSGRPKPYENDINDDLLRRLTAEIFNDDHERGARDAGLDLSEQLSVVERLAPTLFKAQQYAQMDAGEREKFTRAMKRKVKVYDTIKKFSMGIINPYQIEAGRTLRTYRAMHSKLETRLQAFESELRGRSAAAEDEAFYASLAQCLPSEIRADASYETLWEAITKRPTGAKQGMVEQVRKLEREQLYLSDLDDMIVDKIVQYKKMIVDAGKKRMELDEQLKKDGSKPELLQERAKLSALLTQYQRERERYEDGRERILEKFDKAESEYAKLNRKLSHKEALNTNTRDALRHLSRQIDVLEEYIKNRSDVMVIADHLVELKEAYSMIGNARGVNATIDLVFDGVWKGLEVQRKKIADIPYSQEPVFSDSAQKAERDIRIEKRKEAARSRYYHSTG